MVAYRFVTAAVIACAFATAPSSASTISYVGTLIDLGSGWRTEAVDKAGFDLGRTGVLGVDGYYLPGNQSRTATPAYLAAVTPNGSVYGGNGGYASIDDPLTTPGAAPGTITTGTFNPFPGSGGTATTFSFTAAAGAPSRIRVGLLADNLDVNIFNSLAVQLTSSIGGSSSVIDLSGAAYNNRVADWLFFDISGAVAGESFSILNTGGAAGCACLGGVAFDSVVPEPATWLMMIAGFGLVGTALRRRTAAIA